MEKKIALYQRMKKEKLVAVIRAETKKEARKIIDAAIDGGIHIIEVTMTTPGAIELIREVKEDYKEQVVVGAGTVLNVEMAQQVILAGSEFVVSPHLDEKIVKLCNLYQVTAIPGTTVFKDMVEALKLGCCVVKLFPANLMGPEAIKSFKGPLPQVEIMPTGGVNVHSITDWLNAGAVCVGIGSDLSKEAVKTGDFTHVAKYAGQLVEKIKQWELGK